MALFRCTACGHMQEVASEHIGKSARCPTCKESGGIHDTLEFVTQLISKYRTLQSHVIELRKQHPPENIRPKTLSPGNAIEVHDIHNTTRLADESQYGAALDWFQQRKIEVVVNKDALSTEGFFDEVALELGDHYDLLKVVSDQIKFAQLKKWSRATIRLDAYSADQVERLVAFCRTLHHYSFVARFFDNRREKEKTLALILQQAKPIERFFAGEWLEWYAYIKVLDSLLKAGRQVSVLKSFALRWPNEDNNEIDLFFLIDGQIPLMIECKSGDHRAFLQKCVDLRKRLKLDNNAFILLVAGMADETTAGLSTTFGLKIANERSFVTTFLSLIDSKP